MHLPPRTPWRRLVAPLLIVLAVCGFAAPSGAAATEGDDAGTRPEPHLPEPGTKAGPAPESRIVGGTQAEPGAWPSQVGLLFRGIADNYQAQYCGGTLLNRSWVLTAAHCVKDISFNPAPSDVDVLVGTQDLQAGGTRIRAVEFRIVPGWDPNVGRNDLALIRMDRPAPEGTPFQTLTNQNVSPAAGTPVTTTGWGTQSYGTATFPTKLRQVTVNVSTAAACQSAYGSFYQQSTMVCAAAAGKDACQGDSGGPLVENRGGTWYQVGVVSTGYECARAGYPGVYTRVAAFSSWIREQIRYGAQPDANAFVRRMHLDAFNRQPTATELYSGVANLTNGQLPEVYANGLISGSTYQTRTGGVIRLYQAIFLRRPDTAGLQYWWVDVNKGTSLKRIADIMVNASEFQILYGSLNDTAFVELVYENVLGRDPSSADTAYWVGELSSGRRSRGQVMVGFSESPEYKSITANHVKVIGPYFALLRRVPSLADIAAWGPSSSQTIVSAIVKSYEYAARF